jgi:5-oxoprolinase (ATP-hydrolysing) subunit C
VTVEVVDPGPLTSVQDALGRRQWRHLGVPVGGAADAWSARLANRLVGNPDDAALVEMTLSGPILRFAATATIAVTGGLAATVDGVPLAPASARRVTAGSMLRVTAGDGARGYVAVAGGIDVDPVLGSRATDLRSGFGGHEGRALRTGDRLALGPPAGRPMRWLGRRAAADELRVLPGPHADALVALLSQSFSVGAEADRTGLRLRESVGGGGEAPSMGLPIGAVQVPPDGRPIVMLADRPVTGGYRVPAVVIGADMGAVAQLRPNDTVRFTQVTMEDAVDAWRRAEMELAALEPLDERWDDELSWTGSHR